MYDEILFPTDGSDGAETALDHALDLAETYDATVHVLFVLDTDYLGRGAAEATPGDSLRAMGEQAVDETVERVTGRGVDAVGTVREGEPYREIVEYAADLEDGLIVMGTHGRRGLDRFLLGSVTEKVVRLSPVPVLTVRTGEGD